MQQLPEALAPFAAFRQFIIWEAVPDQTKINKVPVNSVTLFRHNPLDPDIWLDFQTAINTAEFLGDQFGIGFVFTEADPFFFLDIDKCVDGNGWNEIANYFLQEFSGAAVEVSQSGAGLHIFGRGTPPEHSCKNNFFGLEFYHKDRFAALTGAQCTGDANTDCTQLLNAVIPQYFPPGLDIDLSDWTDVPAVGYTGPEDDDALIEKFLKSGNSASAVFGGRATIADLWNADAEKLTVCYPPMQGGDFDHSAADAALCQHLAFWTGKNCDRIDRLFRRSALYRDKWEREDYRVATVRKSVAICRNIYSVKQREDIPCTAENATDAGALNSAQVVYKEGLQYLTPDKQCEHFKGCVYVRGLHKAFTPEGSLLKPEQFKAVYGGYIFALDALADKTTRNAWEAFTESQAFRFPQAHAVCFRPEEAPGALLADADRVLVNCYVPLDVPSVAGDPTRFLNHLSLILPSEEDRAILLAYMAAVVQYPGVKFQWCPLIQGCEGNGKTLLIRCVEQAVGLRYTHLPNASDLGGNGTKFNSWLLNKLFIGVEEIYVADRREVSEALKPLITNSRVEIQAKGADQFTGDNRANFMMCSNHKDAVLKSPNDRRHAVFFCAQQTPEDMAEAGMAPGSHYFPDLYEWLNSGGYANVTHFLQHYKIPAQLNPATVCTRAPTTSSTEAAIIASLGGVEQEILECIEQGRPGFAGGWISSMALDRLLRERRDHKRIPPNKRRELLAGLGYVYHPSLYCGRAGTAIPLDGGKPRLYIKRGSILENITDSQAVVDQYAKAQGAAIGGESAIDILDNKR